jgi:hypothetical protein
MPLTSNTDGISANAQQYCLRMELQIGLYMQPLFKLKPILYFLNVNELDEPVQLSRYSNGLWARQPGSIPGGQGIILYSTVHRPAPGLTQPPMQLVAGLLPPGVKR